MNKVCLVIFLKETHRLCEIYGRMINIDLYLQRENGWRPSNGKTSGKAEANLQFEHHLLKG